MINIKQYRSKISINRYANKLYVDPYYGIDRGSSTVNYSVFSSKWDIEDIREENTLKIIHRNSGDSISLSFNTAADKINFIKNIYANHPVKQKGGGFELERMANSHLKPGEPSMKI